MDEGVAVGCCRRWSGEEGKSMALYQAGMVMPACGVEMSMFSVFLG